MPTTLFFTDVVGNESVVKGDLILVQGLQFRASGMSSTITALSPRTEDLARVQGLFGGGTVRPADGGWLTPRFVKQLMGVLVNERSQMHKRSTCLSSIHAPRMANSSLSSYIIKSPPIAEKARSSRDRILCVASCDEANQHPTQFVVCVLLPAQNTLYPQRHPYRRTAGRTCHRSHVKLVLQNLAVQRGHRVVEPG